MAVSPMIQQYFDLKEQHRDKILFFRLGDFYEMFFEDAHIASKELDLTLTGRDCGLSERAPMCGVPHHAVDTYISRLIDKGFKVALCEQVEDPKETKGLVRREVVRVITPGTLIESSMLDDQKPNYILSLCFLKDSAGIAFCDVSTGEFMVYQIGKASVRLGDEISRISPREMIVNDPDRYTATAQTRDILVSSIEPAAYEYARAMRVLTDHFKVKKAGELGDHLPRLGLSAAGALIEYLTETQKNALEHIMKLELHVPERYMVLDPSASANLELTETVRGKTRRGSLLHLLDQTMTSMGSRLMRNWIEQPLVQLDEIHRRQDAVECFINDPMMGDALRDGLKDTYDIERLLSRIAYDTINARDCLALLRTLRLIPGIKRELCKSKAALLQEIDGWLDPMDGIADHIEQVVDPDAPLSIKEGGIIREGYHAQLDEYRDASKNSKEWLARLEQQEREATGIKNLKVGYNRVFGYYIEVTRSYYELVPIRYMRKQTLANCERFITEELKDIEKKILDADENAVRLEYTLFLETRAKIKEVISTLQKTAYALKQLDVLLALSRVAMENDYIRPMLNEEGRYHIEDGRHPVVEQAIGREQFVPNDAQLTQDERVMIITGPNMAGKSTYMRQVALITLMAHIGSFVPAKSADISITDRIFTRIGASDDLYGGQSTFMVEMQELASILKYATARSLLVLDEIGRGTSTFDGLSVAWATVEYIAHQKCGARALFATHYHELSELEGHLEGVVDYRITAREQGNDVIFLRKIVKGSADKSYGVAVASLAGLPDSLISRARQIMARLEVEGQVSIGKSILDKRKNAGDRQVGLTDFQPIELTEEIRQLDVVSMSPIDALNKLFELVEKARKI